MRPARSTLPSSSRRGVNSFEPLTQAEPPPNSTCGERAPADAGALSPQVLFGGGSAWVRGSKEFAPLLLELGRVDLAGRIAPLQHVRGALLGQLRRRLRCSGAGQALDPPDDEGGDADPEDHHTEIHRPADPATAPA